jgi:hypothetical protein
MKGLNNNLIYRPYCKHKDKPSRIPRNKHSSQDVRATNETYDEKEKTAQKFNHKKVSYHFSNTQQLGQRPKKTQQPSKFTQQAPNSTSKLKKLIYVTVQGKPTYVRAL